MTVVITRPVRHNVIVRAPGPRGAAGLSITDVTIDDDGHLVFTLSDDSVIDAGEVVTSGGSGGNGPSGGGLVDSVTAGNDTVTVDDTDPANLTIVVTPDTYDLAGEAALVAAVLDDHLEKTTQAHGGIVADDDSRLSDERTPTTHGESHGDDGGDRLALDASQIATGILDDALIPSTVARDGDVTTAVDSEATARDNAIAVAIANLISSAPGALDTLNELAAALGDDPNFAATITNALAGKQPIDDDLTAIAALTTTAFGRALLELADAAAGRTALGLGSAATHAHSDYDLAGSADAKVDKSTFDTNTILKADADNTPSALVVPASSLVGRLATGGIDALSTSDVLTLLGRTDENIQDLVGAMVASNTETGVAVTYDDTNGKLDFAATAVDNNPANKVLPPPCTSQNFDRRLSTNSAFTNVSGRLHCTVHWFEAGTVVSGLTVQRNSNLGTPTNQWAAILNSSYVPVATTVDQTTTPMAFVGSRRFVFATPYVVPTSGVYYLGYAVAAGTPGQLVAVSHSTIVWGATPTPIMSFMSTQSNVTTPASLTSPVVPASLSSSLWFGID